MARSSEAACSSTQARSWRIWAGASRSASLTNISWPFAASHSIPLEQEIAKLRLIVETAREVWG